MARVNTGASSNIQRSADPCQKGHRMLHLIVFLLGVSVAQFSLCFFESQTVLCACARRVRVNTFVRSIVRPVFLCTGCASCCTGLCFWSTLCARTVPVPCGGRNCRSALGTVRAELSGRQVNRWHVLCAGARFGLHCVSFCALCFLCAPARGRTETHRATHVQPIVGKLCARHA